MIGDPPTSARRQADLVQLLSEMQFLSDGNFVDESRNSESNPVILSCLREVTGKILL